MANNITSADSTFALVIADLYDTPQLLQGYSADAAFGFESVDNVETVMGIDGTMSAGFVFAPVEQTITIMPDSPSAIIFQQWWKQQRSDKNVYWASAVVNIPGISQIVTLTDGVLVSGPPAATAGRVLQAMEFRVRWKNASYTAY